MRPAVPPQRQLLLGASGTESESSLMELLRSPHQPAEASSEVRFLPLFHSSIQID